MFCALTSLSPGTMPIPVVFMYMPPLPPTTFVSPAIILTPAASACSAMECTTLSRRPVSRPSSSMNPHVMYLGTAPIIRRSFTVPHTQSFPISPPLKTSGVTTNESVLIAHLPCSSTKAASSILSSISFLKYLPKISLISTADDLPPLP